MLLGQRANHAHQKKLLQKINMRVTTSQCVISGKITFAWWKLNPPGHNLPTRHKQTAFCRGYIWHFHTAFRKLHQTSPSALRTETSFRFHYDWPEIQIWLWMNNHTDDSCLSQKEGAIFFLCLWLSSAIALHNTVFVVFLHFLWKFSYQST